MLNRWEQPVAAAGKMVSHLKIAFERLDDCRVQRHEPALAELGLADVQDAVGHTSSSLRAIASETRRPVAAISPNIMT